ncbi:acetyl-CoA carboxylase biotin carboxyl carrier protein [bacterium]|nr:acetyl-CoA carboxylase biotin carboxyl carrier protein [bacterium]MDY3020754.1 acetyl-CoA carboxylase biotin carboxyl carrier protein [Oliverpabstia sp.]
MEFENLITLIREVSSSELTDFSMKDGDFKISMGKREKKMIVTSQEGTAVVSSEKFISAEDVKTAEEEKTVISGNQVKAPLVGTYYSASAPDAEPFVQIGDTVKKGQTLGIIEAMKLMNEIESEYDGVVEDILVENGQMVEYGQVLFVIK